MINFSEFMRIGNPSSVLVQDVEKQPHLGSEVNANISFNILYLEECRMKVRVCRTQKEKQEKNNPLNFCFKAEICPFPVVSNAIVKACIKKNCLGKKLCTTIETQALI